MNPDINILPADNARCSTVHGTTPQITTPQQILKSEFLFLQFPKYNDSLLAVLTLQQKIRHD